MHSALVVIDNQSSEAQADLREFAKWASTSLSKVSKDSWLSTNVLLLPLGSELVNFSYAIVHLQEIGLQYRVLFLDNKPDWIYP